jgi:ligand-binding SRPBCC domain-containing protein
MRSTTKTGERAIAGKTSGLLDYGDEVTWRARHFGVWQSLTARISEYDRPRHFQDTMIRGTFKHLKHDHFFEGAEGGCVMRDVFQYSAPFGPLGWLAERLFLSAYLRRFLVGRNRELRVIAESGEWAKFVGPVT